MSTSPSEVRHEVMREKGACKMANERKTFDIGRDSKSGQFIEVEKAERRPNTTTVERVPKPGYGDTKRK